MVSVDCPVSRALSCLWARSKSLMLRRVRAVLEGAGSAQATAIAVVLLRGGILGSQRFLTRGGEGGGGGIWAIEEEVELFAITRMKVIFIKYRLTFRENCTSYAPPLPPKSTNIPPSNTKRDLSGCSPQGT